MEHANAIYQFAIPLLLALLCALASYGLYMHKQFMSRVDRDNEKLDSLEHSHEQRLTRCETKIENVEKHLSTFNHRG